MWQWLFNAPWFVFAAWWLVRSFGTARTERREGGRERVAYMVLMMAGSFIIVRPPPSLRQQLWSRSLLLACVALAVEICGIAFAIWAREHLGRLWSGSVTIKEGHRIVQSGPYGLVRHPIYTGLLVALVGVVLVRGNVGTLVGFALFVAGIARKIALEEGMLRERFGAEYAAYRKKVRAIIPFIL